MSTIHWLTLGSAITLIGVLLPESKSVFSIKNLKWLLFPKIWIGIGSLISLAASFQSSQDQVNFEKELASKNGEISKAQLRFSTQLEQKNAEIIKLTKETMNVITGGKSFCYFDLMNPKYMGIEFDKNYLYFSLIHNGKFPLYDISATIVDLDVFELTKNNLLNTTINIGNIPPRVAISNKFQIPIQNRNKIRLNIFFNGRNGFFHQNLRLFYLNNKWETASRVADNMSKPDEVKVLRIEISDKLKSKKNLFE